MGIGYSPPPPLSEEEQKRRNELNKINSQRVNAFMDLLKELYELKNNTQSELAVEKEKCGRATYTKNYSSTYSCPKCGGGVQQFIENKMVKVFNSRNQIYPIYSNNNCLTNENQQLAYSKFKISLGAVISTKQEENGEVYVKIYKNKYYLPAGIKELYNVNKAEYESNPFFALEVIISNLVSRDLRQKYNEIFHTSSGYDYYYYENPLRNYERTKLMKYYRCIKCHLEYHLYTPNYPYYLKFLKVKEEIQEEKKEENKEESGKKENENQEIKNE